MKKQFFTLCILCVLLMSATAVQARTLELYSVSGFVNLLMEQGIIPSHNSGRAQEILSMIEKTQEQKQARNAQYVDVVATQYIEYGTLEYNSFEDIEGILLQVVNTTDKAITLEAGRTCPVTYTIFKEGQMIYESATEPECSEQDTVLYTLKGNESRVYEIKHTQKDHRLTKGTYRFELEYAGYGSGEREITIQ